MYITTFYSFKGGVGRTLALVNVAVALSQLGRRVLLVDFDLEAPGLYTFDALKPPEPHPGMVDFVSDFLTTLKAPAARRYIYEVEGDIRGDGHLWIMPSGKGDEEYRAKLAAINWRELYHRFDGFILFEDLKIQLQEDYQPDYVFIDSRTGHTEIEGICTRRFPNAVVCLFFPNEQNLVGLRQVVADIRAESEPPRHKEIQLHFVMSNVPDLDDEEQILNNRMEEFRQALGYEELTAIIHHYVSFALLNQVIFTHARPRSRLTREYLTLKDAIVAENIEDREGALCFLKERFRPWGFDFDLDKVEFNKRLDQILKIHHRDGEVLFLVGMARKSEQRFEEALHLLDRAITCGNRSGESLLERASVREELNDVAGAIADAREALTLPLLGVARIERAIRMLRNLGVGDWRIVSDSSAVQQLSPVERFHVAQSLQFSSSGLLAAAEILDRTVKDPGADDDAKLAAKNDLGLCLIGMGRFVDTLDLIKSVYPELNRIPITWAFNYAMAEWGETGHACPDSFARVLHLHAQEKSEEDRDDPNFFQCLAIAFWATAELAIAERQLAKAEEAIQERDRASFDNFSCWRYYYVVKPERFLSDCQQIRRLIGGENLHPLFFPQKISPMG